MLSRLLREFLFTIIHLVVNILIAGQNVYHRFWVRKAKISDSELMTRDMTMILEQVPRTNKKLKHLVVLANTDHHSISDLSQVVIWSLVAGVPFVTFHDITGQLKKNEKKFFFELERKKKGIPGCIKWLNKPDLNGYTNGHQAHIVTVNIFTSYDGRPKIAECIRNIAEDKIPCQRNSSQFTAQELNEALSVTYPHLPDPELALFTGRFCSTHGLLPWQIRLTEFIQLSIDHSINIDNFIGALYKYNKCDQRFGK